MRIFVVAPNVSFVQMGGVLVFLGSARGDST